MSSHILYTQIQAMSTLKIKFKPHWHDVPEIKTPLLRQEKVLINNDMKSSLNTFNEDKLKTKVNMDGISNAGTIRLIFLKTIFVNE